MKKSVRVILWLYAKMTAGVFPNGRFKEKDIYNAVQETNRYGGYERLPQERTQSLIGPLLDYFLLYNEQEKIYSFRDYGKTFCKHAEEALAGNFNPTNIQIICSDLLKDLQRVSNKEMLLSWLDLNFDVFEPKMSSQVEYLDRKIDTAVAEIRSSAQLQQGDVLKTLKKVDTYLEEIRGYNKELRFAFEALKDINAEIEKYVIQENDNIILDKLTYVLQFFPDIRYRLDLIDKRLDKLQPRLRQFFSALNRPLFNAKVESFLRYLLKSSSIQTNNGKKMIQFAIELPPVCIYQPTSKFIIVERKDDLFPAIPKKREVYEETPEKRQIAFQQLNEKVLQQDAIEKWVGRIMKDIQQHGIISYPEYFMEMVEQQNGNIDLAARVTHRLFKIRSFGQAIKIEIDPTRFVIVKNIKIWETRIIRQ